MTRSRRTGPVLEPLINLARLHIRHGHTDAAVDLLWRAVRTGRDTSIDARPFTLHELTPGSDNHRSVCHWLWTLVLSERLRALAAAGRWDDALVHAQHPCNPVSMVSESPRRSCASSPYP